MSKRDASKAEKEFHGLNELRKLDKVHKPGKLNKLNSEKGLARIHVILMILCAILLVVAMVPAYRAYQYHGEWLACADSLRVVNGALVVELLDKGQTSALDEAEKDLVSILPGRKGYCPNGGTVYFRLQEDGQWKAVCGMHDSDHLERTRLNASYVLQQAQEQLHRAQARGEEQPKKLSVTFNSQQFDCVLVSAEERIRRGTSTTKGYEGTVIFYGIEGYGDFHGTGAAEGDLCYLCFANEEYNAVWRARDGWSGTSYGDRY